MGKRTRYSRLNSRPVIKKRRRNWSDDEKAVICGQTRVPGVSVSQIARRYDVNANQVFNWLKDPRFRDALPPEADTAARFLPVEVIPEGPGPVEPPVSGDHDRGGVLEFDLAGGHRLRVIGCYDAEALALLIWRLSA